MRRLRHFCIAITLAAVVFTTGLAPAGTSRTGDGRDDENELVGEVTAIHAAERKFTLRRDGSSGQVVVVTTDGNTKFDDFDKAGLSNTFSSIAVGQRLEVEMFPTRTSLLIAKEVELVSTKK